MPRTPGASSEDRSARRTRPGRSAGATRAPASRPPGERRSPPRTATTATRRRRGPVLTPVQVEGEITAPDGPQDEARLRRAQTEVLRELTRWLQQHRDATGGPR